MTTEQRFNKPNGIENYKPQGRVGDFGYGRDTSVKCSWFIFDKRTGATVDTTTCLSKACTLASHHYEDDKLLEAIKKHPDYTPAKYKEMFDRYQSNAWILEILNGEH